MPIFRDLNNLDTFDAALAIGQIVQVRWRNLQTHERFAAQGTVRRVQPRTVEVTLSQDVPLKDGAVYEAGHTIYAPRRCSEMWTLYDCVLPLKGAER